MKKIIKSDFILNLIFNYKLLITKMVSTIIFKGWWSINDIKKHQDCLFIFGDNDIKKGCGGQAIIRYEDNTSGIPTKKLPSSNENDFYSDNEYTENCFKINKAIDIIKHKLKEDKY